ncbi:hypothetical protein MUB24_17695 [Lederbergia sp. NSJ-179]|uniref:hypothetical protein n=1 Tax=Lederbergia sp. NSJ-179 TaxID=2931402 RepID=UPI001FD28D81|nr:hypothetical protein [Lederbergia sp. NSJ-179]MCJ7842699.1 hypothetical protein [Lederbergia sp. NSJ-179]
MVRWEVKKIIKNRWILPTIGGIICLWGMILYFATQNGPDLLLTRAKTFWHILGSLTIGYIIIFVNTKLFCLDEEEAVKEVILTTRYGKGCILLKRMIATVISTTWFIAICLIIQIMGFIFFVETKSTSLAFIMDCLENSFSIWIGSILFAIFAACICTIFQSLTVTAILCGFLYGMTYIWRGDLLNPFSFEWFLEKGFFSYLIRTNDILMEPKLGPLTFWYVFLMFVILILTIKIQSRRHEL